MSILTESKGKMATREGYGRELALLGDEYKFFVLCADLEESTKVNYFKDKYPERFIECGIAEANMMSLAAGIATTGVPSFVSTFAMFAAGRAYEQIRNSIAYPHLNVKIAATHAGITVGEDGATHQCNEDIALMRTLPGMTVLSPCDGIEAAKMTRAALSIDGPVYIRLGRSSVPTITSVDSPFTLGKGTVLEEGEDVTIIATGIIVSEALKAREILSGHGINARVINIGTIKPIDDKLLEYCALNSKIIFTAEEHSIIGGLGDAVLSSICSEHPVPVVKLGINDVFGMSGTANGLLDFYGITGERIAEKIIATLKR